MTARTLPISLLGLSVAMALGITLLPACEGERAGADDKAKAAKKEGAKTGDDAAAPAGGANKGSDAAWAFTLPEGLTEAPKVPADNPMSAAKVDLGHQLFMDKRLSFDASRSCYSCHQNELGNADGRKTALGAGDKPLSRNTPTIWNVGYHEQGLYWDGRAPSLEKQALGAWKGGNMGVGADNLDAKAKEVGALPEYAAAFTSVFGLKDGEAVTPDHVAMALSAYERTLLCGDTAFDKGEMSDSAKRGWDLFRGKASCSTCHSGDNFSDGAYHNVGFAFDETGALLEGADVGHGKPTKDAAENYKFRTPTLRNVSKTAPYFHDGRTATLEEAVRTMAAGGNAKAPGLDQNMRNSDLSDAELGDVVAFLESLACPGTLEVIGDQKVAGIPESAEAEPATAPEAEPPKAP